MEYGQHCQLQLVLKLNLIDGDFWFVISSFDIAHPNQRCPRFESQQGNKITLDVQLQ